VPFPEGKYTKDIIQTLENLFRFSALTFNAHKIHYSKEWCREVEGHRDCVVHGPLNLVLMVDFWRDVMMRGRGFKGNERAAEMVPKRVEYRATSPVYVNEAYRVIMDEEAAEGVSEVRIVDSGGIVCMKGRIERFLDS
jgi:hydroxyacyl-ACP dehydratase HTD2-like protein with hotdog domain